MTEFVLSKKLANELLAASLKKDFKIYEQKKYFDTDGINEPYLIIYTEISFKSNRSKMYKAVKLDIGGIEGFEECREMINGENRYILKAKKSVYKYI
jgi:hypothetical protein